MASTGEPSAVNAGAALLPLPQSRTRTAAGTLVLNGPVRLAWSGHRDTWLDRAVARNLAAMSLRSGSGAVVLRIECQHSDPHLLGLDADEAYTLRVDGTGITLRAAGPTGILRGLATLRQLAAGGTLHYDTITDAPRFRWRGVMIDVARHFMSLASLKRQIDAMEAVKLNVLHLHLSDNEGFRVESRTYPKLTQGQGGQFYTRAQLRHLIAYAGDRGVRIVPEFDVPGHTQAILRAYPELASAPFGTRDYLSAMNAALNPASPATDRFINRFFGEMARLFPDRWFHVGGDEVKAADWDTNPEIQAYMQVRRIATKAGLQADFMRRVRGTLRRHGKSMIGWDELAESDLPADVAIQTWRGAGLTGPIADHGNPVIVSSGYYLDLLQPSSEHYLRDPLDPAASGLTQADVDLIGRIPAMSTFYPPATVERLRIRPGAALTPAQQAKVLGGEGALWSEIVTEDMLDARLWPRSAALAERFWSSRSKRDPDGLYQRLEQVMMQLRAGGLRDEANRTAMINRIAPGQETAVAGLVELVATTRNHTHFKALGALLSGQKASPQSLQDLADIAAPDSFMVARLDRLVTDYLAGDPAAGPQVRGELMRWRTNAERFLAIAAATPTLAAAVPVAEDVRNLARVGIDALDATSAGRRLSAQWHQDAQALLDRQTAAMNASSTVLLGFVSKQPPADLLILFAPAIAKLAQASARGSGGNSKN